MTRADDLIIDYLRDVDLAPPKEIADAIDYNHKYVGRRCRNLADVGLIHNLGRGLYQITNDGKAYLDGELDARELPTPGGVEN